MRNICLRVQKHVMHCALEKTIMAEVSTGPPEQEGTGGGGGGGGAAPPPPPQKKFLSMCPFFRRALEVSFLKEVTKNVHDN